MTNLKQILTTLAQQSDEVNQSELRRFGASWQRARRGVADKVLQSGRPISVVCGDFETAQTEQGRFGQVTLPSGVIVRQCGDRVIVAPAAALLGEALADAPAEVQKLALEWADSTAENSYRAGYYDGAVRQNEPGDIQVVCTATSSPLVELEKQAVHGSAIRLRDTLQRRRKAREAAETALQQGDLANALLCVR